MVMPVKHWAGETLSALGMWTWQHNSLGEKPAPPPEMSTSKNTPLPLTAEGGFKRNRYDDKGSWKLPRKVKTRSQLTAKLGFCCKIFPKVLHQCTGQRQDFWYQAQALLPHQEQKLCRGCQSYADIVQRKPCLV